ncbi:glycosyltransferase family 4 protein [Nonomuraea sp. KC401]|uniref:glycosyltransferase family 4 protein n=1 Tax=unclassified Nonomuraea TaxID=2593643 RepID=UPI0010FD67D2|nr:MULTISPECIES: glycosyltransferase family 4 protein [unclassified Nonomuraea]NBE98013.1 glycosyltransferase [Nonomuraea sp. K271]TLF60035.1 glycosyltransferase family 4 protein [Nonomuraea sp. KC401]
MLLQNMYYEPALGGANRSGRRWMELLAARGHECMVLALVSSPSAPPAEDRLIAGVRVRLCHGRALPATAASLLRAESPDWVLVPSDDPGQLMLGAAVAYDPARVVYVAHTIQQLPFGPAAYYPSAAGTRLLRKAGAVVSVSEAAAAHLTRWAGLPSVVIRPHVYADRPPPSSPPATRSETVMVNPCAVKGIELFLALAAAFPEQRFVAIPTWGTTPEDRAALDAAPNVTIREPEPDLRPLLRSARALVMPSLWDETFGYTCVEAMAEGVPVLASDVGGLREAKLGVPYRLPVRPVTAYRLARGRPVPTVPEQDPEPWRRALGALLSDEEHHRDIATRSRAAADAFIASLDPHALERHLIRLSEGAT